MSIAISGRRAVADVPTRGLLLGGDEVPAASGQWLEVVNPASGEPAARVAAGGAEDVDRAVELGLRAFREGAWSQRPIAERAQVLQRLADGIERRIEELYRLETVNNGRPLKETRAQVSRLPEWYRYNAALLLADRNHVVPMPGPYHSYTQRFPLGVVGILSSFNHPLMIGSKSLAPALATGNSVVLKPSEQTPLTSLLLGEIAAEAGRSGRRGRADPHRRPGPAGHPARPADLRQGARACAGRRPPRGRRGSGGCHRRHGRERAGPAGRVLRAAHGADRRARRHAGGP